MKRKVIAAVITGMVAACAAPVAPPPAHPPEVTGADGLAGQGGAAGVAAVPDVVRDLGHAGGPSLTIQLYAPVVAAQAPGYRVLSNDAACWAFSDIYQYDVTLQDTHTGAVLTAFTVPCKGGRVRLVLQHLKPGLKYAIAVVARGNAGGTAPDTVLNSKKPAIGYFDLTQADPWAAHQEISAAIQVELDCEGTAGYERTGRIDIVPTVKGGNAVWAPESGQGDCFACGDFPVSAGTTTYDSMFHGGTNGDVFNVNQNHNHWTNEVNGWGWVQRELPFAYPIRQIEIGQASNDARFGTLTEIYVKLRTPSGNWITVDNKYNQNLQGYALRLPSPMMATAFRLELKSANGWVSASAITLKADTGVPCPPAGPSAGPSPCYTPEPSPSPSPSQPPSQPPCATPTPSGSPPASSSPDPTPPCATPTPTPSTTSALCAGPFATFTQGGWGATAEGDNPGNFRDSRWYQMTGGSLTLGTGKTLTFTSSAAVAAFLPTGGTADTLAASATNPTASNGGVLAGQLLALKLNVLKSDAGLDPAGSSGELRNVKFAGGKFQGQTIGAFLALAERALGGDAGALPNGASLGEAADAAAHRVRPGRRPASGAGVRPPLVQFIP